MRNPLVATVATAFCAAAVLVACFPQYAFVAGDGGPGSPDGAGLDGSALDGSANDGPTADGTTAGDGSGDSGLPGFDGGDSAVPVGMVAVNGSTFHFQVRSDGADIDAQATLDYRVAIDQYEMSVARFTSWVDAGMPMPCHCDGITGCPGGNPCSLDPGGPYDGKMTWDYQWSTYAAEQDYTGGCGSMTTTTPVVTFGKDPASPITCVMWEQALAVCAWEGKRLPTDTEWRFFATGQGTEQPFPWGTLPADCQHAIGDFDGNRCGFPVAGGTASAGVSKDGVYDLVGSLSEWLWDFAPPAGQPYAYPADAGTDYLGPSTDPGGRQWIGGDFSQSAPASFRSTWQGASSQFQTSGYDTIGFRCAKSLR